MVDCFTIIIEPTLIDDRFPPGQSLHGGDGLQKKIVSNGCMSHVFYCIFLHFLADLHVSELPRGIDRHTAGVKTMEKWGRLMLQGHAALGGFDSKKPM